MLRRRKNNFKPILPRPSGGNLQSSCKQKEKSSSHLNELPSTDGIEKPVNEQNQLHTAASQKNTDNEKVIAHSCDKTVNNDTNSQALKPVCEIVQEKAASPIKGSVTESSRSSFTAENQDSTVILFEKTADDLSGKQNISNKSKPVVAISTSTLTHKGRRKKITAMPNTKSVSRSTPNAQFVTKTSNVSCVSTDPSAKENSVDHFQIQQVAESSVLLPPIENLNNSESLVEGKVCDETKSMPSSVSDLAVTKCISVCNTSTATEKKKDITCSPVHNVSTQGNISVSAVLSTVPQVAFDVSSSKSPVGVATQKQPVTPSKVKKKLPKPPPAPDSKAYRQRIALNKLKQMELKEVSDENKWTNLDRNSLSMSDLIYINPSKSDGKELGIRAKLRRLKEAALNEKEKPPQPSSTHPVDEPNEENNESPEEQALVPQIRVNEDGTIVLDEESLTIKSPPRPEGAISASPAVYESGLSNVTQASFKKKTLKSRWTEKQTKKFYFALGVVGADFGLMSAMFRHRNRDELRRKFHLENRKNLSKVDAVLRSQHLSKWTNEMFMPESSSEDEAAQAERKVTQKRKRKVTKAKLCSDEKNSKKKQKISIYAENNNVQQNTMLEKLIDGSTMDLAADISVATHIIDQSCP